MVHHGIKLITRIYGTIEYIVNHIPRIPSVNIFSAIKVPESNIFFWTPVLLGSLAPILLLEEYGITFGSVIISALLLAASFYFGKSLQQRYVFKINKIEREQSNIRLEKEAFYSRVFPVWSNQISTCRNVGNLAVTDLTMSFSAIVSRLENILKISGSSNHDCENQFLGSISNSQVEIQAAFNNLHETLDTVNSNKNNILAEITQHSDNMKEMAESTKKMALESRIIALNAEIEAARAGQAGKPFAAVVTEIRQLSNQSIEASADMSKKAKSIESAVFRFNGHDEKITDMELLAENIFKDIDQRFHHCADAVKDTINVMADESRLVKDDISEALVLLQFQDRLSQIMDHVTDNIEDLNNLPHLEHTSIDSNSWLINMESKFSTREEHSNLNGATPCSAEPSTITMF